MNRASARPEMLRGAAIPFSGPLLCLVLGLALLTPVDVRADSVVVFNEILFHPAAEEPVLEWVELHNQNAVDVDLGGWRLSDAVDYLFPHGTTIKGGGYLVVAISPAGLQATAAVTNLLGPFSGRLANDGEEIKLRDLNNRIMDAMDYSVDGEWPVSPDGSGTSLAKRAPNLASGPPENWTASAELGGTPGRANFSNAPILGPKTNLMAVAASWRFNDSGVDPGTAWRAPLFDDHAWSAGTGLFYFEDGPLPAPRNTLLAPARNAYYFRGTFQLDGDPADKVLSFRPVVDDGAVVYVNGAEVIRFNMPTGAVSYATMAAAAVGNAGFSGPFSIPSAALLPGLNVIAVEVHQTSTATNAGLRVIPAAGFTVNWDGDDGDFFSPGSPALVPPNDALATRGVEVFTSSNTNLAARLNDGLYGNSSTWSPTVAEANPIVILRFNQAIPVSSIAWSRDNGDTNEAGCAQGACADRSLGNFTFQYTLASNPAAVVVNSINPSNGWTTLATVQYFSTQPGFTPHLRHRFEIAGSNGPVLATGIRFRPPNTNSIDEIEINPPAVATFDAVFGLELAEQDILPPSPKVFFNEVSGASPTNFWLEVINAGETTVGLDGMQIARGRAGGAHYLFPPQPLAPGAIAFVPAAQLNFGTIGDDKLFLYTAGRRAVLDAVTVKTNSRGRSPDGAGEWMYPSTPTPGGSNVVFRRTDVVINEIMYHAPPIDPVPALTSNVLLQPLTGTWRYQDTGVDLGTAWRAPAYPDHDWPSGPGLLAYNAGTLPAPSGTVLAANHSTYYFRTRFQFSGAASNVTLDVRAVLDDGAVFYLNGIEIQRVNMPGGTIAHSTSAAGPVGNAGYAKPILVPATALVAGENVLAVEVHQWNSGTAASGIVLAGGGLALVEEGPAGGAPPANLARQPGAAPFVIDSLAGFPIHDFTGLTDGVYGNSDSWIGNSGNPGYAGVRFGGSFTIQSLAFGRDNAGTLSDRTLGTYTLQFTRVASPGTGTTATGNADTGWATIGTLTYQAAGTGLFTNPSRRHRFTFTPVEATGLRLLVPGTGINSGTCIDELEVNPPETSGDVVFGAELSLTTTLAPAQPYRNSDEEWVELYNRSQAAVDLGGWRLDAGIDFRFTNGPILPPDGYLVVARNAAALRAKWPEFAGSIVGDFSGRLEGGERFILRDAQGNPVHEARVFESGWSDGGGSSSELREAGADALNPAAWADSDESAKGVWKSVTYRMVAGQVFGSTRWNEFRVGLLDEGIVLLDDISVVRDPDGAREELIQNGDFEITTGDTHWRFLGHHRGEFVLDPDSPGNHVLKLSAADRALMNHNHVESTFLNNVPLADGQLYEVRYRARWVAGSPQVNTRGYFSKLARTTLLPIPARLGTPGAPNSRRVANAGPTLSGLRHAPVVPLVNQPVTVSVRALDPQGVASLTLHYRVNPAVVFTNVPMALQQDGSWAANIPGQAAGRIIQFYVTAVDLAGAATFAPAQGPASRALCQVADLQGTALPTHELRLIMLDADRDFMLNPTNVMSNARNGATLVYNRSEVYYDAGARLQGTAASRIRDGDNYVSYDIDFPEGQLFRGVQNNIGIDRSGRGPTVRGQDEMYVFQMFHRASLPIPYHDLCYFIAPRTVHTGPAILQLAGYGGGFVAEQYGGDGSVFNMDITYEPDTTVGGGVESIKLPVPHQAHLGTDFTDLGDQEQYRSPFDIRLQNRRDDYSGVMRLGQVMALPQAEFDAKIAEVLDVDQALRMAALEILCGIQDTYISSAVSLPHNLRLITPVNGDPAQLLPWDMDFVFGAGTSSSIFLAPGVNLGKLLNHPGHRRTYLYHVHDLCRTAFTTDYMNPWLAHYGSKVGQNFTAASAYITSRRAFALSQLPPAVPFAITSNGGQGFATATNFIELAGTGWIDLREIEVNGIPYALHWVTLTNWSLVLPLRSGTNFLTVQGVDRAGDHALNLVDSLSVTNTAPPTLLPVVINEWMSDNSGPGGWADSADGLFQDWFELFNPNEIPVPLGGYYLTDNLGQPTRWKIPTNTTIAARGFLVVWADENGAQNTPTNADLHASFKLDNLGEAIGLFGPDGISPQHSVQFGFQWQNISEGLFPDGAVGTRHLMTNWSPGAANRLGQPAAPQVRAFTFDAGLVSLTFDTLPGRTYRVERKDDLNAPDWIPLGGPRKAVGESLTVEDIVGSQPQQFLRVRLE